MFPSTPASSEQGSSLLSAWSRMGAVGGYFRTKAYEQKRNRPILILGELLFVFMTISLILPVYVRNTQQFTGLYVGSSVVFTVLSIFVTRSFVRPVFPIVILLAIQVWMMASYFLVAPYVIPSPIFGRHLYWPILIILPYFVLGSICILDPSWRQKALKILFYVALVNALVGIGQFLRLPGFHAIQTFFSPLSVGFDYEGNQPALYRAVGLTLHPYHLAAQCIFGLAVIGSNLLERKLFPREILGLTVFLASLFVAQTRAYYASGAIVVIILLVLLFRKDRLTFTWSVAVMSVAAVMLIVVFGNRLSYGLRGQNTIELGRTGRWSAAAALVTEFPLTGIGPSTDLFGNDVNNLPTRRHLAYPESGYRMLAGTGGIPGVTLLIIGLVGTLWVSYRVAKKNYLDSLQRRMAFVGAMYIISMVFVLGISNTFEYELLTFFGVCTAAISLPDAGKAFSRKRRRLLGYGFANSMEASSQAASLDS